MGPKSLRTRNSPTRLNFVFSHDGRFGLVYGGGGFQGGETCCPVTGPLVQRPASRKSQQ